MKKFLMIIMAMMLLACNVQAEEADILAELLSGTYGDALEKAGDDCSRMVTEDRASMAFTLDGIPVRVVAELDDTAKAKDAEAEAEEDFERRIALHEEYWEYLNTLPVTSAEVITAEPLSREELDALTGKTVKDLEGSSFDLYSGELRDEWLEEEEAAQTDDPDAVLNARPAVLMITDGMFRYEVTLDITRGEYWEIMNGEKPFDDTAVTGVTAAGLSKDAADLEYLADGTYTGSKDLLGAGGLDFGEASGIMEILTAAMNGEEGLSMDPDVLFDALIKIMPDREEEIRTLIPVIIELANQEAEAE